jgi:ATP-dependent Clp protease, protease subunit
MKRSLQALASPKRIFSAIKNDSSDLEIMLYDQIGYDFWTGGGATAKDLADQLKTAGNVNRIVLRINSPGGDVFEGAAMYNLLTQSQIPVDVIVDGLAASAASYIAMSGNTITMGQGAMMMIHNPWSIEMGDANALRKMADTLDKVRDSMLSGYMNKYDGTQDELKALLDAETWLTAQDAVDAGFADQIAAPPAKPDDKNKARALARIFDLSQYKNTPADLKPVAQEEGQHDDTDAELIAQNLAADSRTRMLHLAELA